MEECVEPGADHYSLGQPEDETTAERGQDQRQSRRDAGEVQLHVTKHQRWRNIQMFLSRIISLRSYLD